jgi:hypothetical protein
MTMMQSQAARKGRPARSAVLGLLELGDSGALLWGVPRHHRERHPVLALRQRPQMCANVSI